jgi:tetratricopeptide (TPR) repeat protein
MLVAAGRCRAARAITLAPPLSPLTAYLATLIQDALGPDYRIEQELDGGGMSRLFMATDLRHNRRVVVKVLSPELVTDTSTARFKREIELTVRLQHPHILPILTSGARDDALYYITPFIPGESLKARIERDGKLPLDDIIKILRDASGALAFAHARGVVHRDVKPGNILLAEGHAILADFGIAKAVAVGSTQLTATGLMPGTPAYMAPELPTEESGDVYALGVVGYEMLTGALPTRGAGVKEILAARGRVSGDDKHRLCAAAELVASATSRQQGERVSSASGFLATVEALATAPQRRVRAIAVPLVVLIAAVVIAGLGWERRVGTQLSDRYAVLSLGPADSANLRLAREASDALGEWQGVSLADQNVIASRVSSRGGAALTVSDAWDIARSVGARNAVVLETTRDGDSVVARASLYDTRADTSVKVRRVAFAADAPSPVRIMEIRRLVNALVRDGTELPWRSSADRTLPLLRAWKAYDRGRDALRKWDLAAAEAAFRDAIGSDQQLALAHLWLAQTIRWESGASRALESRALVRRAIDAKPPLPPLDSIHAAALLAIHESRFPRACELFRELIARDSADAAAWLGYGDCQAGDREVVRNPRMRTGWAFRTSFEGAARAYQRAGDLGPSAVDTPFRGWLLGRLSTVMYSVTNHVRLGFSVGSDTVPFAALPYRDGDTTAFAPYLAADLAKGDQDPPPALVQGAIGRNRTVLRRAAEDWVRHSPHSAAAYDSLAAWTEVSGGLALVEEKQASTIDIVRRALALSRDSTQRLRLAITEVRLLIKDGKFAAARSSADSLLRSGAANHVGEVAGVAGIAVLTGQVEQAADLQAGDPENRLMRLANGSTVTLPTQLNALAARIVIYAIMGLPPDSLDRMTRRAEQLITSYVPIASEAAQWQRALLVVPSTFAYPESSETLRRLGPGSDPVSQAYYLLAIGDSSGARKQLATVRRLAAGKVSGTSIDGNFRRARLALALGDTVVSLAELDPLLQALPTLGPALLSQVAQAASLLRSLALRAEIAARRNDRATAVDCARAIVELWVNADARLRPTVDRMKAITH